MNSDAFDVIPFEDIKGEWKKLGSGSFGNVYKGAPSFPCSLLGLTRCEGTYLGIDVAIKEVLPSTDYDVAKYFEREWRLMKEARHPNVVLYLGLSRAPDPDGRIFIISEFIEGGNLRGYIYDKTKPLPWRLRLSFATDIARALAYLHARKCIHRDLKGENLLVTANGRLKITDFGFARIAARNEEESKRLTFCGTDSYMSPEILLGHEFDLPTDIFSLGIILCEIAARKLASDTVFKRYPPGFGIDEGELRKLASKDCPQGFVSLCLDCLNVDPSKRPTTRQILDRLRDIEAEVIARSNDDVHVGSIKFVSGPKRPGGAPRIPSFGEGIGKDIRHTQPDPHSSDESEDEDYDDAVQTLKRMDFDSTLSTTGHSASESVQPLLDNPSTIPSDYSTSVVKKHPQSPSPTAPSLSSILTIRPAPNLNASDDLSARPLATGAHGPTPTESLMSIESYHTASSSSTAPPSIAAATEGGSSRRAMSFIPTSHRFTLIKLGAKRVASGEGIRSRDVSPQRHQPEGLWNHLDFLFNINRGAKCDLCTKKLGWKESVECDDCGLRAHMRCSDAAPMDCGTRRLDKAPTRSLSPISRVRPNGKASPTS